MKLTTKGRFAVTAMLDIALQANHAAEARPVSLADISARQQISLSYLEQLFGKLRRKGLVNSIRGPGGGYELAHSAEKISVSQIISAVDEEIDATQCSGHQNCTDEGPCMTHELWATLNQKILSYLSGISLNDMVLSQEKNNQTHVINPPKMHALSPEKSTAQTAN